MSLTGKVLKYEAENINTDVIWPGKYTYLDIPKGEMINYVFENYDPDFKNKIKNYRILVAGKNFGCGSSREQPAIALKAAGINAIIAPSFARIFYRNAINQGLPVINSQEIYEFIQTNDEISLNLEEGFANLKGKIFSIPKYPDFLMQIILKGGLVNYARSEK